MNKPFVQLIINPGSTSTKIALFEDMRLVWEQTLRHPAGEINNYVRIYDQYAFREKIILDFLKEKGFALENLDGVVGRGGLIKAVAGGTYRVNTKMVEDLKSGGYGEHASNLGAILAQEIASQRDIPAFIVDPVVVDEMDEIARISGLPELQRKSIFHALNQKAVARRAAAELGKQYHEVNIIVAHLGGGITVGAHKKGKVVDVNNGLDGDGPFSPERAGGLPAGDLAKLCFSGTYTPDEIKKKLTGGGGLVAYLHTNNAMEVEKRIKAGDEKAELIYKAMAYQVAKEIGACAAVLAGDVDAIILTGGIAHDRSFTNSIKERVLFIAPLKVYPGEDELIALAQGGLRVLQGKESAKEYR